MPVTLAKGRLPIAGNGLFKFNGLSRVIIVKATIVQRIVKLGIVGVIKRRSVLVVLEFLFRDGLGFDLSNSRHANQINRSRALQIHPRKRIKHH